MRKQILFSVLAVFAIFSLTTIGVFADTNPNLPVIRIVVLSPSGQPIQGANVYTSFEDNVNVEYQLAHTNAQGRASFNIANDTLYSFLINGTQYAPAGGNFNFTSINGDAVIEVIASNACHTDYTLKGPIQNYTVTLKQKLCGN